MLKKVLLLGGIGLIASLSGRMPLAQPSEQVVELHNPALPGSVAPSLSATPDGKVILSWLEPAGSVQALRSAVWDGKDWGTPEPS